MNPFDDLERTCKQVEFVATELNRCATDNVPVTTIESLVADHVSVRERVGELIAAAGNAPMEDRARAHVDAAIGHLERAQCLETEAMKQLDRRKSEISGTRSRLDRALQTIRHYRPGDRPGSRGSFHRMG